MEALIEREAVRPQQAGADLLQAAEAGLQFLRLLDAAKARPFAVNLRPAIPTRSPCKRGRDT